MDNRGKLLQGEYRAKAKKADRKYGNTIDGELGKMEQKLLTFERVRGLVVGGWAELSVNFKMLMQVMVEKKKQELEAQTGMENRKSVTAHLASFTSQNLQQLSRMCVQAQSGLLLDSLEGLGGEHGKQLGEGSKEPSWRTSGRESGRLKQQDKTG